MAVGIRGIVGLFLLLVWIGKAYSQLRWKNDLWTKRPFKVRTTKENSASHPQLSDVEGGMRITKPLFDGLTSEFDVVWQSDKPAHKVFNNIILCKRVALKSQTPISSSVILCSDVAYTFDDNAFELGTKLVHKDDHEARLVFNTRHGVSQAASQISLDVVGRKLQLKPSHNFLTGQSLFEIDSCIYKDLNNMECKGRIIVSRNRKGEYDADLSMTHILNDGKDVVTPSISYCNKLRALQWLHKFKNGAFFKLFVNSKRDLKLFWSDEANAGRWITVFEGNAGDITNGRLSFRREFSA